MGLGMTLSKKTVRFCPECGANASPDEKTVYSVCSGCGISYTNSQAKILYEQALENKELLPYPEDWYEKVHK